LIKLQKGDEPQVLQSNSAQWTAEVLALANDANQASAYQKSRYNNAEVKAAIIAETHGKCAYCESKVLHIDFGDIEHILPKKERPDLWFEWRNLTLACGVCNNSKRAYFNENLPLLDPYLDDPECRLLFFGPLARPSPGDANARMTEHVLGLNRPKLVERRKERLDHLLALAALIDQAPDALKPLLKDDFLREMEPDREYVSLARTIAKQLGLVGAP
jgi:uncharacterized protein (TIGR02646 family)